MKKTLLSIALFTIVVSLAGCGGGSGSSGVPHGVNPGVPSVVQLLAVQTIAQTNSSITFKAKVLDGNGRPVPNEPVTFINLSSIGTWPSSVSSTDINFSSVSAMSSTVRNTDSLGYATNNLFSPTSGFATIQVEVNTGVGQVRNQRTVFFTTSNTLVLRPTLTLAVDGDGDGTYNETGPVGNDDFTLFETATDNQVMVRATVLSGIGLPVFGSTVTFGADVPYRVGADPTAACSDGSTTCEVTFPFGNTAVTTPLGQAFVFIQVTPAILRTITTTLNITASADNGAGNLVTLFLSPVTVTTVTVSANPTTVASAGTSKITAFVLTTAGTPVPDGTSVSFTISCSVTNCGGIVPFAQTTDGIAEVTFTAPTVTADTTVTITATVAGVLGTTTVTVTTGLVVTPDSAEGNCGGDVVSFMVTGGSSPYSATSTNAVVTIGGSPIASSGDFFTATIGACAAAGDYDVIIIVMDDTGDFVEVTLKVIDPAP